MAVKWFRCGGLCKGSDVASVKSPWMKKGSGSVTGNPGWPTNLAPITHHIQGGKGLTKVHLENGHLTRVSLNVGVSHTYHSRQKV